MSQEHEHEQDVNAAPVEQEENQLDREVIALKNKNQELLSDLAKMKQFRKTIDELGGLDTFKEIVTKQKEAKLKQVEDSGDMAAIKKQYQDEVAQLKTQLDNLNKDRLNTKVEEQLRQAVQEAGGIFELVAPAMKKHVHAEMTEDGLNLEVLDETGHLWIKDGRDAKLSDLVEKLRADTIYSKAFDKAMAVKTGSGATNSRRRPEVNPWLSESRDLEVQTKIWLDNPDKARRMMQEAGVEIVRR